MSIEQYQQPHGVAPFNGWAAPAPAQPPARQTQLEKLNEWAQAAQAAYQVAERLVVTSFVPAQFKNKPAEATAAILSGSEVGLSPMASLRSFDIIQGVAAPRAITQRAIVQGAGHDMWVVESTESRAVVSGQRRGSDKVQTSTWTIDRARGMQLTGKDNWKKQPGAMLVARASSECARLIASDALLGMPYSYEELQDGADQAPIQAVAEQVQGRTVQRRTAPTRKATANTRPAADPNLRDVRGPMGLDEPPLDEPDEPAESATADDEPPLDKEDTPHYGPGELGITKAQLGKLHAGLSEAGLGDDRDRALKFYRLVTGRAVESSKDLTKAEASSVIDELEQRTNEDIAAMLDGDTEETDQLTLGGAS